MERPLFVIENLEPRLSGWVLLEYLHSAMITGSSRLVVTNVKNAEEREILRSLGLRMVYGNSVADLFDPQRLLVLDPAADTPLRPADFIAVDAVVVGGIMGDNPPKGRTWRLLSSRLRGARLRNLGSGQLSVDGAVYVALQVFRGTPLELMPLTERVILDLRSPYGSYIVELPFTYPLVGGKPLLAPGLEEYLARGALYEESLLLDNY